MNGNSQCNIWCNVWWYVQVAHNSREYLRSNHIFFPVDVPRFFAFYFPFTHTLSKASIEIPHVFIENSSSPTSMTRNNYRFVFWSNSDAFRFLDWEWSVQDFIKSATSISILFLEQPKASGLTTQTKTVIYVLARGKRFYTCSLIENDIYRTLE